MPSTAILLGGQLRSGAAIPTNDTTFLSRKNRGKMLEKTKEKSQRAARKSGKWVSAKNSRKSRKKVQQKLETHFV